ncbi:MAG: POTRA domain-containing protein, partial [Rhizonema sp. PD38]|nr:POTRA domain-containing protein [Rhizonema sp. PD38]
MTLMLVSSWYQQPSSAQTVNMAQLLQPETETAQTQPQVPSDIFHPPVQSPPIAPEKPQKLSPPEKLFPIPPPSSTPEVVPNGFSGTIFISRFNVVGSSVFSRKDFEKVTDKFAHRQITFAELLQASEAVTQLYRDRGYITSGAFIPANQILKPIGGSVNIQVIEGGLEDIKLRGTSRISPNYVRGRLSVATSKPLNINRLLEALKQLLLNPLIENLRAELSAGLSPGTSLLDITLSEASLVSRDQSDQSSSSLLPTSEFIVTGRGGLPPNPDDLLTSDVVWIDWRSFTLYSDTLLQEGKHLYEVGQFAEALKVFQRAEQSYQIQGNKFKQALTLTGISLVYQQLGLLPQASKAITESLNLLQENNSKEFRSVLTQALNTQGQIQLAQGQAD